MRLYIKKVWLFYYFSLIFLLQLVVDFIDLTFCNTFLNSSLFTTSICISNPANFLSIVFVITDPILIPARANTDPKSDKTPTLSSVFTSIFTLYKCSFLFSPHIAEIYLESLSRKGLLVYIFCDE